MLVWLDIETTGLNPAMDLILEVGFVITDDDLNVKGKFQRVVSHNNFIDRPMDPRVISMHTENHLFQDVREHGVLEQRVLEDGEQFLIEHLGLSKADAILCGSSIDFDRGFLRAHPLFHLWMPFFTYRVIDVSTLKELAKRWYPMVYEGRPVDRKIHRVVQDLEDSIAELRHYRENLFR